MIMTRIKTEIIGVVICLLISGFVSPALALDGFTQADRERLVRVEAIQTTFMQQVDKRLEQVDKRIEQVDKRFEQVDKRFEELRSDMNARFEQQRTDMNARFEQQRSDINARFEQVDKRFGQTADMFYALAAIFTTLFAAVFGFAWWDRRSILITARNEVNASTQDIRGATLRSEQLIEVLRSFAENVPDLKMLMRQANLL
jgi:DNA repair exonuclease SbcCD ATPase subunit